MATAQASIHSRHDSVHVQHAFSKCFSPSPPGARATPAAAIANNPHKLNKAFRLIIDLLRRNSLKILKLGDQFITPRELKANGMP